MRFIKSVMGCRYTSWINQLQVFSKANFMLSIPVYNPFENQKIASSDSKGATSSKFPELAAFSYARKNSSGDLISIFLPVLIQDRQKFFVIYHFDYFLVVKLVHLIIIYVIQSALSCFPYTILSLL